MYLHSRYISLIGAILLLWLAAFSQAEKLYAQTTSRPRRSQAPQSNILRDDDRIINQTQSPPPVPTPTPPRPISVPEGNILRDDERQINQTQLPWVLVSNQPNQEVSLVVTNKISGFLTKEGLTPISCSTNPVVVISINNKYVACSSPTIKFPPGTYNTNIPDLEPSDK
ncbi:hypothetical protein IQ264_16535 [Phormidium sp. LEGE 05292]|uniref:hypothetical protein n=1 Tax=[Phormidium] sp. LEGE 05292 TaxID=767427 RepID=UPI00188305F0|nr:hypothetical protein [Phormidium sp. LEGE 05292]MBE9227037.1 hypothetical protein [Phormidium sp. LEGE 05292]